MTQLTQIHQAFITAAGRGSRLQSIFQHRQKSCLPIQEGVSLLEYHIRGLMVAGIRNFVVNTCYRADEIVSEVNCLGRRLDVNFRVSGEGGSLSQQLGTAGALFRALAKGLLEERFIFMYGDLVHFSSYKPLEEAHVPGTITCTCTFGDLQRGDVVVRRGDGVVAWHPRPHTFTGLGDLETRTSSNAVNIVKNAVSCYLNAGIYIVDRSVLEDVSKMQKIPGCKFDMSQYNFSLDKQLIPYLLSQGLKMKSILIPSVYDVGTPDSYADALNRVRARYNKKALFLDRDGILLKPIPRKQYITSVSRLQPVLEMSRVISAAMIRNYIPIQVSNQPHVAKGLMSEEEARTIATRMQEFFDLPHSGVCPHEEKDDCNCRKPRPGMLLRWEEELGLDLRRSFLLGDSLVDAQAALRVGVTPIILRHEYNKQEIKDMPVGTLLVDRVEDAVKYLL